ncbi:MAG: LysR family transcriptional regulator [Phenylobacterium sp.]|uniref:LysR substrate-binding domain-containing protein n=1 Tax=Phenylobacterium sp. TaxID=1871053 RepID=UPI001A5DD85F|nr:LysR substrate-binding domain-containing protein [Phenylobacterium sp.]MBL8771576.1 LysR family transcriptional regulator [Phenylobacterium sp.]
MRLPPLTALRAFEAVGRLGNVREAADELNVTPAAVSHQIRTLEDHLGVELFVRGARGLQLTGPGAEFLASATEAFQTLHAGVERLARRSCVERLVVNSLPSFAANFLVPRLAQFHQDHPNIELEINTGGRFGEVVDLRGLGADIAIRAGLDKSAFPGLTAERLVPEVMFPVCTASTRDGPVALRTPDDLVNHTLIIVSRTPEGWPEWIERARALGWEMPGLDPHHGLRFDTIQLATTAALQGMGVVIGRRPLVDNFLTSGALVAPFDIEVTSRIAYWLVYSPAMASTPRLQAFRTWLRWELGLAASELA